MGLSGGLGHEIEANSCSVLSHSGVRAPPHGCIPTQPTINDEGGFGQTETPGKGVFSAMGGFEASHCGLEWLQKRFSVSRGQRSVGSELS